MTKTKKILIDIYIIGVICVCVILVDMFSGGNEIINPNAMLPSTYIEKGTIRLAMGAIPMCIVSYLLFREFADKKRYLLFIPAIITACNWVYWTGIMALGYINSFFLN